MPKGDRDYSAEAIAQFDQTMAEIEAVLDLFVDTMGATMRHHRREEVIVTMAAVMAKKAESTEAACQYLAIAVYRIHQMRATINSIIGDVTDAMNLMTKDNDSPPSNS